MALGFSSYDRLERMLLNTRNKLGEGTDDLFKEDNKTQALQFAASFYNLYDGDGSETTYTDAAGLTIIQSEMIATKAAVELTVSAISFYKDDVVSATAGPSNFANRNDKLAWLKEQCAKLEEKLEELEDKEGLGGDEDDLTGMGLVLQKVMACKDPVEDRCEDEILPKADWKGGCC